MKFQVKLISDNRLNLTPLRKWSQSKRKYDVLQETWVKSNFGALSLLRALRGETWGENVGRQWVRSGPIRVARLPATTTSLLTQTQLCRHFFLQPSHLFLPFSHLFLAASFSLFCSFHRGKCVLSCLRCIPGQSNALLPPIPITSFLFELQPQQLAPKLKIEGLENFSSLTWVVDDHYMGFSPGPGGGSTKY